MDFRLLCYIINSICFTPYKEGIAKFMLFPLMNNNNTEIYAIMCPLAEVYTLYKVS